MDANAKFCRNCGALQKSPAVEETKLENPASAKSSSGAQTGQARSTGMALFGSFSIVAGILVGLQGVLFYVPGSTPVVYAFGTVFLTVGILSVALGYGYLRRRPWAWLLGVLAGALLVDDGVLLASLVPLEGGLATAFGAFAIVYTMRGNVKAHLED